MPDAPSRHLLGPRPPPLRLNAESRNIRKQPAAAAAKSHRRHPPPPVIIHIVSPKIIYVDQNEFRPLVQRLTGLNASSSSLNSSPPVSAFRENGGGVFPAGNAELPQVFDGGAEMVEGVEILQPTSSRQFHGIPAMPQNIFRHATDFNPYSSLTHLNNAGLHGNMNLNNYLENNYLENNLLSSQMMNMPSPSILDLFNSFSHI